MHGSVWVHQLCVPLVLNRRCVGNADLCLSRRSTLRAIEGCLACIERTLVDAPVVWRLQAVLDQLTEDCPRYRCTITLDIMRHPLRASSGQTYEAEVIRELRAAAQRRGTTMRCPLTRLPLHSERPNSALRRKIEQAVASAIATHPAGAEQRDALRAAWRRMVEGRACGLSDASSLIFIFLSLKLHVICTHHGAGGASSSPCHLSALSGTPWSCVGNMK